MSTRRGGRGQNRDRGQEREARDEARRIAREATRTAREAGQEAARVAREAAREAQDEARGAGARAAREAREAVEPIWARAEPGSRRPRFTRDDIAAAALRVADAEGLDAVSMRRVAADLGAGTMTLYHYVANKQELLDLMHDAVMGELVVPEEEFPSDWRGALTHIARRTRQTFLNHPWAFQGRLDAGVSPNTMRHIEQSLDAVSDVPLEAQERLELVALVDDFVFGAVLRGGAAQQSYEEMSERERQERLEAVSAYVKTQIATDGFPHLERLLGGEDAATFFGRMATQSNAGERFERGLSQLLDGIALHIELAQR